MEERKKFFMASCCCSSVHMIYMNWNVCNQNGFSYIFVEFWPKALYVLEKTWHNCPHDICLQILLETANLSDWKVFLSPTFFTEKYTQQKNTLKGKKCYLTNNKKCSFYFIIILLWELADIQVFWFLLFCYVFLKHMLEKRVIAVLLKK